MAWLPNTCNGDATIVSLTESNYVVDIVNMTGRVVYREEGKSVIGENSRILNFPGYAPGIYLVMLNVEGNHVVKKLIIE